MRLLIVFIPFLCFGQSVTLTELTAFPEAVGWARDSRGWASSPAIRYVTNTNDSGAGSFRAAMETNGPAIVICTTDGKIELDTPVDVGSDIYFAGQTAYYNDGEGIVLTDSGSFSGAYLISFGDGNLIRYLSAWGSGSLDTARANTGTEVYIDHCSFAYGLDEVIEIYGASQLTMAYTWIFEGVNGSGTPRSILIGNGSDKISLYGLLFANNHQRNPLFGGDVSPGDELEIVNCYLFNPGGWGIDIDNVNNGSAVFANIIGNRIDNDGLTSGTRRMITLKEEVGNGYYLFDNKDENYRTTDGQDQADIAGDPDTHFTTNDEVDNSFIVGTPYAYPLQSNGTIYDVDDLRDSIVAFSGGYLKRKSTESTILNQIDTENGLSSYRTTSPSVQSVGSMTATPVDANSDGIFDDWTSAYTITNTAGYSDLELFLAELAGDFRTITITGEVPATAQVKLMQARRRQ